MSKSRFADPKNEITIKHLFGSKGNEKMTTHFLNHMLPAKQCQYKSASFVGTITLRHKNVRMQENGIKLLCEHEDGTEHFVFIVFSKRSKSINVRAFTYLVESISDQGLEMIRLHREYGEYLNLCDIKSSFMLVLQDTKQPGKRLDKYIFNSSDISTECDVENPFDQLNGTTIVALSHFTLSQEQVKTPREKWSYFLKHGHPGNQHDLERIVDNDAMFKCAYEALNMDDWPKEEISQYEEYMQRKAQEDAEGYETPGSKEVTGKVIITKSLFSGLIKSSESEESPDSEESSNSEEEREETNALLMLETIRRRREERRKWKKIGKKLIKKASLEKEKEQKMKKAEVKEEEVKKKAELKRKG
jgi:hypothetical protein